MTPPLAMNKDFSPILWACYTAGPHLLMAPEAFWQSESAARLPQSQAAAANDCGYAPAVC